MLWVEQCEKPLANAASNEKFAEFFYITHTSSQNLKGKHVGGTSELPRNAHTLRLEPEPLTLRSVDLVAEETRTLY